MTATRTETDSFGPLEVPADKYWGAQTQRSLTNFPFPAHQRMPIQIVHAQAAVKQAAARILIRSRILSLKKLKFLQAVPQQCTGLTLWLVL